ncbi:MAG TPA: hypothetical protein VEA77_00065 [Hyphomicrobium sp.]|nr:hypothetical protein [Hyphomicrobium sp.]
MRFYVEAIRHVLEPLASFSLAKMMAAGGACLAAFLVIAGALFGAGDIPDDAVSVTGPVFTPVAVTAPAPTPAVKPSGPNTSSAPRFEDAASITRAVQSELKRAGCYSGPVNGIWTASTRAAMGEFTARVNARLPVEHPDPVLLALLETHNKISCTAECSVSVDGGRGCVPRGSVKIREELASIEETGATASMRDSPSVPLPGAVPTHTAEDLGYSDGDHRAPNPIAAVQATSTSAETDDASLDDAAVVPSPVPVPQRAANPTRTGPRKYKKQPSLSRQVSKGLKSLQRSFNSLF